jgi:integrase
MRDRVIGALDTCCRKGEMLKVQNRHVDWNSNQIAIPGAHAKDSENRRIPFDPHGRLADVFKRRAPLGPNAYVFGTPAGTYQESFRTAWESLLLVAHGHDTKREAHGARVAREVVTRTDLHCHDLRHEGACRLLAERVDLRAIQLMLRHADLKQTQRYLNVTDEELRRVMAAVWERRRGSEEGGRTARPRRRSVSQMPADHPEHGAPGRTRTCDPRLRRPMLYPTELRAHIPS